MEEFEKKTENNETKYEEITREMPGKSEGIDYEEIITITKIS